MIRTRTWILILLCLLLLSAAAAARLHFARAPGRIAVVYRDGVRIRSVDLDAVEEPYEFTVSDGRGENTVRVEPGRICVCRADCPDQICVKAGWLTDGAAPVVCLPHRLVIRLEKDLPSGGEQIGPDGVAG